MHLVNHKPSAACNWSDLLSLAYDHANQLITHNKPAKFNFDLFSKQVTLYYAALEVNPESRTVHGSITHQNPKTATTIQIDATLKEPMLGSVLAHEYTHLYQSTTGLPYKKFPKAAYCRDNPSFNTPVLKDFLDYFLQDVEIEARTVQALYLKQYAGMSFETALAHTVATDTTANSMKAARSLNRPLLPVYKHYASLTSVQQSRFER